MIVYALAVGAVAALWVVYRAERRRRALHKLDETFTPYREWTDL